MYSGNAGEKRRRGQVHNALGHSDQGGTWTDALGLSHTHGLAYDAGPLHLASFTL
jgi:hypothetical protein